MSFRAGRSLFNRLRKEPDFSFLVTIPLSKLLVAAAPSFAFLLARWTSYSWLRISSLEFARGTSEKKRRRGIRTLDPWRHETYYLTKPTRPRRPTPISKLLLATMNIHWSYIIFYLHTISKIISWHNWKNYSYCEPLSCYLQKATRLLDWYTSNINQESIVKILNIYTMLLCTHVIEY